MPAAPSPIPVPQRAPASGARWPGGLGLLVLLAVIAPPAAAQVNGGASWRLGGRTSLSAEVFYSPLSVVRPPSTAQDNDPLLNLRTMLRFGL